MTIYIVRHPATAWTGVRYLGRRDLAWSGGGRRRADQLVARFRRVLDPSALIVTSPLLRASAFAGRLVSVTGCALEVDERWTEVDVGNVEGETFADLKKRDPRLAGRLASGNVRIDWPAGEQFADLEARVFEAFDDVKRRLERPAVVVTHAGPIAVLLDRLAPTSAFKFVGPGDALALDETSPGRWIVRSVAIAAR